MQRRFHFKNQHDKKECVENECTCTNGVAVTGTKCDVHGRHHCEQCNHHYVLSLLDVGHRTAKEAKSPYYTDEQDVKLLDGYIMAGSI